MQDAVEVLIVPMVESVLARRPSYWARFLIQAIGGPADAPASVRSLH